MLDQERRFEEHKAKAIRELETMTPRRTCPCCPHVAYPIVVTQHCWCDPGLCRNAEHGHPVGSEGDDDAH